MFKNKSIRNWGVVVVVIVAILFGVRTFASAKTDTATANTEGKVVSLNSAETIEASGSLEAQPFAALDWKTSGVVEKVNVQAGDVVKAGDVLLSLQISSASSNIISAQSDLVTAQKNLDNVLNSTLALAQAEQDLANAKQAVEDAQEDVTKLDYRRYSDDMLKQAKNELILADRDVSRAEDMYKNFKDRLQGDAQKAEAELNLINARKNRDNKQATLDWYLGTPNDLDAAKYRSTLAVAQAQEGDAQREVDRLKDGPTAEDVAAAQAKVDAAQATVNMLYIIAPFDGKVLSVEQRAGEVVNTGNFSVNLADMDHLYVNTQVDESDIANVKLGNQAEVTLEAVPGVTLTGKVTAINPVGENVSGLVKYTVRVDLDKVSAEIFLPLGTTASVVITVKDATATLAVPIAAIQNDTNGEYVWVIQADGSSARVDVVSGSIVDDAVVVTGDLKEGDRLQLIDSGGFQAPNPLQGGE
jgi:HlyD family secretion protein